jgi:tyrosine-specific transport protein
MGTKLLGGTLLLTGTAMGGGLLALPIATAQIGFLNATGVMIACWLLMTTSALLTLEVSFGLPLNTNIISITQLFLNRASTGLAWISYLFLFYSLVAAYIAGGADFIKNLLQLYFSSAYLQPIAAILFTTLLGSIVYLGMYWVDYLNRGLMFVKLSLYALLVALIAPHINSTNLLEGSNQHLLQGFGVLITSFSYSNIIPSLRDYFKDDIASLRKAILIGSSIPLVCYIIWNASVMGVIAIGGKEGLIHISHSSYPTSSLINQLNAIIQSPSLFLFSHSFTCVCVLTTFLTCSLGLSDFLADGLKLTKKTSIIHDIIIYSATFLPPLCIAILAPSIFIKALDYAGTYCLILFILLPVMAAWKRYHLLRPSAALDHPIAQRKWILVVLGSIAIMGIVYNLYRLFLC